MRSRQQRTFARDQSAEALNLDTAQRGEMVPWHLATQGMDHPQVIGIATIDRDEQQPGTCIVMHVVRPTAWLSQSEAFVDLPTDETQRDDVIDEFWQIPPAMA